MVCPSAATARDLAERSPDRAAEVVPLAAAERFGPAGPAREYVLAVGTLEPRRNLPRLIETYAGLPDSVRAGRPLLEPLALALVPVALADLARRQTALRIAAVAAAVALAAALVVNARASWTWLTRT